MVFEKFLKSLNPEFETILSAKFPLETMQLNSDISTVRGRVFYRALDLLTKDFDKDCENALSEVAESAKKKYLLKQRQKTKTDKPLNQYQKFITQFLSSQADVSKKAHIDNSRFTKVLNLTADDFYAHEVFSLAISQNITPRSAFEQLYKTV